MKGEEIISHLMKLTGVNWQSWYSDIDLVKLVAFDKSVIEVLDKFYIPHTMIDNHGIGVDPSDAVNYIRDYKINEILN